MARGRMVLLLGTYLCGVSVARGACQSVIPQQARARLEGERGTGTG